ncbi:MAG: hypothetical protein IK061_10265 [Desulfovibrio sp.]|nr:hypothetical protein [Desulfovibrio sp.]
MDLWKFVLAVIRETRVMPVFALGLLGAVLVLAPELLEHYGFAVGEGAAKALHAAGSIALGAIPFVLARVLDRRP